VATLLYPQAGIHACVKAVLFQAEDGGASCLLLATADTDDAYEAFKHHYGSAGIGGLWFD
jgi:hypothetical protein